MGCHASNYDTFYFYPEIDEDGGFGEYTAHQLQYFLCFVDVYDRALDGDFGYYSVVALQSWIRRRGYYPAGEFVIDGDMGDSTWAELRKYVRYAGGEYLDLPDPIYTDRDLTIRALQRWLNKLNGSLPYPMVNPISQYDI